jgi:gliding motility-associated-like protein
MLRRPLNPCLVRLRLYGVVLLFVFLSGIREGQAQLPIIMGQKPSTCSAPNGELIITPNFGSAPYTYYLNGVVQPLCSGNSCMISGLAGATNYSIDVSDGAGPPIPYPGGYYLSDLAGPTIVISSVTPATCLNNDGGLVISQTGGNGPFTYSIDNVNFVGFGTFTGQPSGGPLTATVQDVNMCTSSTRVTIPLNNDLVAATRPPAPACEGTPVTLLAGSNGQQFGWSPATGLDDPTKLNPVATPSATTTYTLTATRGICTLTADELVTINPAPIANAGADVQTCYGKTAHLQGSGGKTYQWTPSTGLVNANAPLAIVQRPDTTITYALSVTDANGCTSLKSDSATVIVTPPLKVLGGPDTIVSVGQPVQLYSLGPADPGGSSYQWTPGTGLSNPLIQDPIAILNAPEEVDYIVRVTTSVGCTGTDTVVVKAMAVSDIFVPNAFSPNNDGHNDLLRPIMPGIKTLKYFTIFDRWGRQVFTTSNAGVGWDGTLKGQVMETGVYVWMAMGVDISGKVVQRKGTVVLVK